jgi:hypothetical protein
VPPLVPRAKQACGWGQTHGRSHALFSSDCSTTTVPRASVGLAVGLPRLRTEACHRPVVTEDEPHPRASWEAPPPG